MTISIDNINYEVRHNYLHRGNARLVLNHKEGGGLVWVQFEKTGEIERDLKITGWGDKMYKGYWCTKSNWKNIELKIINTD